MFSRMSLLFKVFSVAAVVLGIAFSGPGVRADDDLYILDEEWLDTSGLFDRPAERGIAYIGGDEIEFVTSKSSDGEKVLIGFDSNWEMVRWGEIAYPGDDGITYVGDIDYDGEYIYVPTSDFSIGGNPFADMAHIVRFDPETFEYIDYWNVSYLCSLYDHFRFMAGVAVYGDSLYAIEFQDLNDDYSPRLISFEINEYGTLTYLGEYLVASPYASGIEMIDNYLYIGRGSYQGTHLVEGFLDVYRIDELLTDGVLNEPYRTYRHDIWEEDWSSVHAEGLTFCGNELWTAQLSYAVRVVTPELAPKAALLEEAKLLASDGAEDDLFGWSVSNDGRAMVVGANGDGSNSGSAYVFRYDPEGSGRWVEEAKLLASDGAFGDQFGVSVSIDGDAIVVGAFEDNDNGVDSGSAYVFRYDGSDWVEEAKLLAPDGAEDDSFGWSVSIDRDAIVVGAYLDDDNGSNSGSVYVFRYDGFGWVEEAKLLTSDGTAYDFSGSSVSIDGDTIVVGAYGDDDNGLYSGSAYVFRYNGVEWVEEAKLLAFDGAAWDFFSWSVSIDGDAIVVGARLDEDNGSKSGSVYVFRYDGFGWVEEAKLLASDGAAGDYFGTSVSIDGDAIVVKALYDTVNGRGSGSAYVFRYNGSDWVQEAKLLASDGAFDDYYGRSVSIDGDAIVVGSKYDNKYGTGSGLAYFERLVWPTLSVEPETLMAGELVTFDVVNCRPNTETYIVYSTHGRGWTVVQPLSITLDLQLPALAGTVWTDDEGDAEWSHVVAGGQGYPVWFQAIQYQLKTNVVSTSVR